MRSTAESLAIEPRIKNFKLTKWEGNPPGPGEKKTPLEVIMGEVDEATGDIIRPVAFKGSNDDKGDVEMIRVKAPFSVNNGYETAEANEIISVSPDQAKKIVALGGNMVTKEGEAIDLAIAVKTLQFRIDELPAEANRNARESEIAAAISE